MRLFFSKAIFVLIQLFCVILNIANSFLSDVAMYETTSGLSFNWWLLVTKPSFWIIIILQVLYAIATAYITIKNEKSDARLKKAIEDQEIKLMSQAVNFSKKGDFDSANKVIKILDKFEERRNN